MLGMLSALQQLPMLVHLLRPDSQHKVNVPKLLQILKPNFSEEGSNTLRYEKEVYQLFVRYAREVASGRRSSGERQLELCHILEFATGASEEPVLGFNGMDPICPSFGHKCARFHCPSRSSNSSCGFYTYCPHLC